MELTGKNVAHKRFGQGVIKSCEGGVMQVYFQQYGARCFHYPEIFDKFMTTDDMELTESVSRELAAWHETQAAKDARLAESLAEAAAKDTKPAPKRRRKAT